MPTPTPDGTPYPEHGEAADPVRFAYWVPNVSGGLVVSTIDQRTNHTPAYNIDTARTAERLGFDYALTQVRYLASYGADAQHESVSFSLGLLAQTDRLKVIAAVHPGQWPPHILAKLAATAQELYDNRLAINVVSGWFKKEYTELGLAWLDHEERYRRSEEFIEVLRGLWGQDPFTFRGDFYRTREVTFRPSPTVPPEIFQGGNSTSARAMAGRLSDWYFMNGQSVEAAREQVADVKQQAARHGRLDALRFGLNGFAVVRDTVQEARDVVEEIIAKADVDKVNDFGQAVKQAGQSTPDKKGMWADSQFADLVQYNDGFRTGLVGTPESVARRIVDYKAAGVDLLLLGFLHVREDVERFGRDVIPLVRELESEREGSAGYGASTDLLVARAG